MISDNYNDIAFFFLRLIFHNLPAWRMQS